MPTLREEIKAAATEIQRLAQRRVDVGPVENQDWCDHTGGPARFKIECVDCIVEIITGAARAHGNRHAG
jgi:hypothetical protein